MGFVSDPAAYGIEDDGRQFTVRWRDGHESRYALGDLRKACPCADCRTAKKPHGGLQVLAGPGTDRGEIRMVHMEPVGRYALRFTWSDGHSTGIYSFDFLRGLCPCDACRSGVGQ